MKTDLFLPYGHCWAFQICWHIECSSFTASSFKIWNSSAGIPSPPLALFVVMLSKAHLTLHSRMSGSRWVITPSWLSGWLRFFVCTSVYFWRFLISSYSFRSALFLSFTAPSFAWNVPLVSNFLEEISSAAAAAAKSLQLCPTLCDPMDKQPTRLPRPWDSPGKNTGVGCHFLLQCMKVKSESEAAQLCRLLATTWTAAYQAPLSMGFSRQEYWSGLPLPSPG